MVEEKSVFDFVLMRRLRRLSVVPRWTVIPTIRRQSVAEHVYQVQWLTLALMSKTKSGVLTQVEITSALIWALMHEELEAVTGDLPSPTKSPEYKQAMGELLDGVTIVHEADFVTTQRVADLVKVADLLEAVLFLNEEIAMGNKAVTSIRNERKEKLMGAWAKVQDLFLGDGVLSDFIDELGLHSHPILETINADD